MAHIFEKTCVSTKHVLYVEESTSAHTLHIVAEVLDDGSGTGAILDINGVRELRDALTLWLGEDNDR